MSRTEQPRSWATLSNTGEDLNENKQEPEDNKALLLSVFDSLNKLYERLNRLDYILTKKRMEQELYPNNIKEFNEIMTDCDKEPH